MVGVSASWVVPYVNATQTDTFSAVWIGIGGQFDRTLIQCGTEQDFYRGQTLYSAWYELLPQRAITIPTLTVSPGDQMQASIQLVNDVFNQWSLNITDVTSGLSFQNTFTYAGSRLSAEWIVERPTVNGVLSPLADFGNVTFTACQTTIGSATGSIIDFNSSQIVMFTKASSGNPAVQLTDVSLLSPDGTSFTVTYLG